MRGSKKDIKMTARRGSRGQAPIPARRENCRHCSGKGHTVYINRRINCGVCFGKGYLEVGR